MLKFILVFLTLQLGFSCPLFGAEVPFGGINYFSVANVFVYDHWQLWQAPLRLKHAKPAPLLMIGGAVGLSFAFDRTVDRNTRQFMSTRPSFRNLSTAFTEGAGLPLVVGLPTVFYAIGSWGKLPRMRKTGLLMGQGLGHSLILTYAFKAMTGRQRPNVNGKDHWQPFPRSWKQLISDPSGPQRSFPSGHSALAWTMASVLHHQYPEKKWVGPICYSLAAGVSASRVGQGEHWVSDALVGSLIGYGVGRYLSKLHTNTRFKVWPFSKR